MRRSWGPTPKYERVRAYERPEEHRGFLTLAGPCSVESEEQIQRVAEIVARAGATHLRGGLFRAGTYPGQNFGIVDDKLVQAFHGAAKDNGLLTVIEILDYSTYALSRIAPYADCFQVGARQMQNYTLLRTLGSYGRTVFLKRNPGATMDEWLGAAEHLLVGGPCHPALIERGSASSSGHVRWDLSISMIPAVQAITSVPVIVDPSHGTGRRDLVPAMAMAGVAAGADGVLLEVHPDPERSLSDADQAITPETFEDLMPKLRKIRNVREGGICAV